jgi:DNA modification methylase
MTTIADLKPDKRNRRKHNPRNLGMIERALGEVGAARSIVIDEAGNILAGNGTVEAAAAAGIEKVQIVDADGETIIAVRRSGLTDEQKRKLALYDNRTAELAEWDVEELLRDQQEGLDLSAFFGGAELDELLKSLQPAGDGDAEPQIDRAEELRAKWGVELGQLWQIGEHRLVCGDCTDRATVEKVMGGDKFRLCFTSPPYADQREYHIGDFDWLALMTGMSDCLFSVCGSPCDIAVNLGMSYKDGRVNFYWNDWLNYCDKIGHALYGWYVWDKGRGFPGEWNGRLSPAHEFIFHFSIGRVSANKWVEKSESSFERNKYKKNTIQREKNGNYKKPTNVEAMAQVHKIPDSVIRMSQDTEGYENHPAIFPVSFPEFGIKTWSDELDIIADPFGGSGTTMVACQNLGRKCRMIEISPAYCAVIIERMATAFPGIEIQLVGTPSLVKLEKQD